MVGTLVLTRHGQSEWNKQNLFTGWKDPALTELGVQEAIKGGKELNKYGVVCVGGVLRDRADTRFDIAFTSDLQRAQKTLDIQLKEINDEGIPIVRDRALNERDYGELTGLNKDDARKKWGEEQVHTWRRSFDVVPPGGESLKLTAARVLPFYGKHIRPLVLEGKSVLVTAHGNSLRAMIMEIEHIPGDEIVNTELETGVPIVYKLDEKGNLVSKEILR
ncbi:phosphoglycerate mutase (2,3-diphosphoglycerate-dependent) [Malassezia sp. CBS 17886]|nr:phosphoglycerate mutase (2,3-diphosphoglycerate-dependent) [Malassezia sp. CBS 17886]